MQHVNMIFVVVWQIWKLRFKPIREEQETHVVPGKLQNGNYQKKITTTLIDLKLYNHRKLFGLFHMFHSNVNICTNKHIKYQGLV